MSKLGVKKRISWRYIRKKVRGLGTGLRGEGEELKEFRGVKEGRVKDEKAR